MSKQAEIEYFEKMTQEARQYARNKPFSADQRGAYLIDIGQILSLIPAPPARLLDIGCGSGWTTAIFAKSGYETLGVDISPAAICLAQETFACTGAEFAVCDFDSLSYEGMFDIAVLYDCLHHADCAQTVLRAVYRALSKEGEVIIVEPGRGHHDSGPSQCAEQTHGVTEKDMPPRLTTRLLRSAGFFSVRVFPRAQFQLVERKGTGGIVKLLTPFLGSKIAALAKTLKNSVATGQNGIVLAKKTSNKTPALVRETRGGSRAGKA